MNIIQSNIKFNSNMAYGNKPDTIVLHHAEASSCSVYDVDSWHKANGWAGIGYHYFVNKKGEIYTGRPENAIGAHCPSENSHSIGICAEGAYMTEQMPVLQKQALIDLGKYIKNKYGLRIVGGHKEYYSTDCPGTNYPLAEIKAAILNGTPAVTTTTAPQATVQTQQGNDTVKIIQSQLNALLKLGLRVDGFNGAETTKGINTFKGAMGLPQNGEWDLETVKAITEIYTRLEDWTEAGHFEYATRYIQYRVGSGGDKLGTFWTGTKICLQNWQTSHGLKPDGVAGTNTWKKLIDENC